MTERLFSSRTLSRTLAMFFDYPRDPLNPRLICRYTETDIKSVLIVLRKLENMGLVRSRRAGKYNVFILEDNHPLFEELCALFSRTREEREDLRGARARKIWHELFG